MIKLNVGGIKYNICKDTINNDKCGLLYKIIQYNKKKIKENKEIYIDRNGELFKYILEYYRNNILYIPKHVDKYLFWIECNYWGIGIKKPYDINDITWKKINKIAIYIVNNIMKNIYIKNDINIKYKQSIIYNNKKIYYILPPIKLKIIINKYISYIYRLINKNEKIYIRDIKNNLLKICYYINISDINCNNTIDDIINDDNINNFIIKKDHHLNVLKYLNNMTEIINVCNNNYFCYLLDYYFTILYNTKFNIIYNNNIFDNNVNNDNINNDIQIYNNIDSNYSYNNINIDKHNIHNNCMNYNNINTFANIDYDYLSIFYNFCIFNIGNLYNNYYINKYHTNIFNTFQDINDDIDNIIDDVINFDNEKLYNNLASSVAEVPDNNNNHGFYDMNNDIDNNNNNNVDDDNDIDNNISSTAYIDNDNQLSYSSSADNNDIYYYGNNNTHNDQRSNNAAADDNDDIGDNNNIYNKYNNNNNIYNKRNNNIINKKNNNIKYISYYNNFNNIDNESINKKMKHDSFIYEIDNENLYFIDLQYYNHIYDIISDEIFNLYKNINIDNTEYFKIFHLTDINFIYQ